jgi:hypothetical protein
MSGPLRQLKDKTTAMRIHRILCFVAAAAMAQLALAELPFSNDSFGRLEGVLDFCGRADQESAAKYKERKEQMTKDVPKRELTEARGTKEYKEAYESVTGEFGKAPKDQAAAACKAYLEGK